MPSSITSEAISVYLDMKIVWMYARSGMKPAGLEPIWVAIVSSIFGALVTILTSINQFDKYHQRWVYSKVVAAKLRQQYYLKNRVDAYVCEKGVSEETCKKSDYKIGILAKNCEEIILKEAVGYVDLFTESKRIQNRSHYKDPSQNCSTEFRSANSQSFLLCI